MSDQEYEDGTTQREWTVPEGSPPERLDKLLAAAWSDLSRSRLQALIRDGRVLLDGAAVMDPGRKAGAGARLVLHEPPPAPAEPQGEAMALAVVYEDEDLIVIDKPAGLVVHPAAGHASGTLVNALIAHCGESLSGIGGVRRPGIVHRLDKDTSGLLVVAKNDRAHQGLAEQFADHGRTGPLERAYAALVWGVPERRHGTVEAALARGVHNREKIVVVPHDKGRYAITHYALEEELPHGQPMASLVRCELETGRTHQIRVHMAHIGHPLLGDSVYGSGFKTKANRLSPLQQDALSRLGRQALHAAVLGFQHPRSGDFLLFESPLPADLQGLLDALRS
ncbi:RluA family pseudouridine synthase [Microvirga pudoricolor]|uniref:RluA family pseudouridine synthase n=1 Tax=Microvirga pudoricolor TaxID=2778729 RepID=UPI001950A3A1|nr:RluA family pseudouridine synthase [Microvirga pudoricolor]MBM6593032.1 RluA family pseudouridine synthase [Microvirga pudoricolor]